MTPEKKQSFLQRWSKGQIIYTPQNDLSKEEEEALMTRPTDQGEIWEEIQDMIAPVCGMIVFGGIVFLIWKFGYLLS